MTEIEATALPGNLRAARMARGLSLRTLGAAVGVSHQAIKKYEEGHDTPGARVLVNLARALGVPLDCLFSRGGCTNIAPDAQLALVEAALAWAESSPSAQGEHSRRLMDAARHYRQITTTIKET